MNGTMEGFLKHFKNIRQRTRRVGVPTPPIFGLTSQEVRRLGSSQGD